MKRDMELMREILFAIEEQYDPGDDSIEGPEIDGYDMKTIAEHCDLLEQQGLIKTYTPTITLAGVMAFSVGNLTNAGYDYLELIRNNEIWEKTHTEIEAKKLPNTFEQIAEIAGIFFGNFVKGLHS